MVIPQSGNPTTQTFDLNGNLQTQTTGTAVTTFTWDTENRLTAIALPAGKLVTNIYDGNGLRQAFQDSTGRTTFTYDGQNIWRADQPSATTNRFSQLPGVYGPLLSQHQTSPGLITHTYAVADMSNNIAFMTQGANPPSIPQPYPYGAFGSNISSSSPPAPFGFGGMFGYYVDPSTGLIYVRARWYDPVTGRWMSRDLIGFDGGDWDNLYRYVVNNAVNGNDPLGLKCLGEHSQGEPVPCSIDEDDLAQCEVDCERQNMAVDHCSCRIFFRINFELGPIVFRCVVCELEPTCRKPDSDKVCQVRLADCVKRAWKVPLNFDCAGCYAYCKLHGNWPYSKCRPANWT